MSSSSYRGSWERSRLRVPPLAAHPVLGSANDGWL